MAFNGHPVPGGLEYRLWASTLHGNPSKQGPKRLKQGSKHSDLAKTVRCVCRNNIFIELLGICLRPSSTGCQADHRCYGRRGKAEHAWDFRTGNAAEPQLVLKSLGVRQLSWVARVAPAYAGAGR